MRRREAVLAGAQRANTHELRERIRMEQLKGLPLGKQLILGAGVLLLIDTFFDWQQISASFLTVGQNRWHGFWGIVMCLALLGLLAWRIVMCLALLGLLAWTLARAFAVALPAQSPDGLTSLGLAALILLFAIIKALSDSYLHWLAYLGIILAAAVAYGAWLVFQASGETLPYVQKPPTAGTDMATTPEPAAADGSADPI